VKKRGKGRIMLAGWGMGSFGCQDWGGVWRKGSIKKGKHYYVVLGQGVMFHGRYPRLS